MMLPKAYFMPSFNKIVKRIEIHKNKKNSKKLLTVYIVFGIVPIVATISKTYDRNRNAICGSVGTGRRARLRIL